MDIVIDLSAIPTSDPIAFSWWFIKNIGWIIPVFFIIYAILEVWKNWLRSNYRKTRKYMLLAVDVPRDLESGPKGVENIFNQLAGAGSGVGWYEKWWTGEIPESFSFEIVSIEGYIQFLIHFEQSFRDLVEAIIYAQYPAAEITEVEDYTRDWNVKFPNAKYDMWGGELKLTNKDYYPIRTHPEFEHVVEGYKDSMSGLLEALNRVGPGQQVWIQFVCTPAASDWTEGASDLVKKLTGEKGSSKKNWFDYVYDIPNFVIESFNPPAEGSSSSGGDDAPNKIQYLTPGQKDTIAAIEKKAAKIAFYTKIRIIYLAEKPLLNKPLVKTIVGAFKQFNTMDLNGFKVDSKTATGGIIFRKTKRLDSRKNKMLSRYKNRGDLLEPGTYGSILNSEELASVYHFPTLVVKTPLVKKSEAKKAEPPMSLPIEASSVIAPMKPADFSGKSEPPANLPTT